MESPVRSRYGRPARAPMPPSAAPAALERNRGTPLDLGWVREIRVNRSAVERRAATLTTRRTVKQDWQVAWLLRAVTLMDLTTLAGDDTAGRVRRLCAKARHPVRDDVLAALGAERLPIRVGAVCVYHNFVAPAATLSSISRSLVSIGVRPAGKPVLTAATGIPLPASASTAGGTKW